MDLLKQRVIIVSYTHKSNGIPTYMAGPTQDLLNYLKTRTEEVAIIEQPDPISEDLTPTATVWEGTKQVRFIRFPMFWFPLKKGRRNVVHSPFLYALFKIRDWVSTIYFLIKLRKRFALYIGVESPNTLLGILLRGFGVVKKVVYDMIDYSPKRFESHFFNSLFHQLDKFCVYHSDFVWNQTKKISEERFQSGFKKERCAPQLVKPSGVDASTIRQLPLEEIERHSLIYVGSLLERDGVQLLIDALPEISKKVPQAKVIIVGEGDLEKSLQEETRKQGLNRQCQFLGMIGDQEKVEELMRYAAIGIAPYLGERGSVKYYNDVSKPKVYMACGLPIIITKVPPMAEEVDRKRAGIAIQPDSKALADAAIKLLTEDNLFTEYRKNALEYVKDYQWNTIFDRLFEEMTINGGT